MAFFRAMTTPIDVLKHTNALGDASYALEELARQLAQANKLSSERDRAIMLESAMRRGFNAACEECAKECDSRKHIFPGGAPDWQHGCEACAEDCRAKQVKP